MSSFAQNPDDNQGQQQTAQGDHQGQSQGDPAAGAAVPAFNLTVGDRTFDSPEAAANHIKHAQDHISTLESDNAALRQKVETLTEKVSGVEELKSQVASLMEEVKKQPSQNNSQESSQTGTIQVDELVGQVKQSLNAEAAAERSQSNWDKCADAAKAKWGEDFAAKVGERAQELGLEVSDVDAMAKKSPAAFNRIILEQQDTKGNPERTSTEVSSTVPPVNASNQSQKPHTRFTSMSSKDRASEVQRRIAEVSG